MEPERIQLQRPNASDQSEGTYSAEFGPLYFPIDFWDHLFAFTFIFTPLPSKTESKVCAPPRFFGVLEFRGRRAELDSDVWLVLIP